MNLDKLVRFSREMFHLDVNADMQRAFRQYASELLTWNAHINLTAITDPEAIEMRHFLDSLSVLRAVPLTANKRVIDVGTGAGFPGIPLRIVFPQIDLTLLEATSKKARFLEHVAAQLKLTNITILNTRAEDAGQQIETREAYDIVLARAVAQMPVLSEYLLPLCRVGGHCVALKGENAAAEVQQAEHALRVLGGRLEKVITVELPEVSETHHLVVIRKVAATPPDYPRRTGVPTKRPIEE